MGFALIVPSFVAANWCGAVHDGLEFHCRSPEYDSAVNACKPHGHSTETDITTCCSKCCGTYSDVDSWVWVKSTNSCYCSVYSYTYQESNSDISSGLCGVDS